MITAQQAALFGLSHQEKKILNLLTTAKEALTATSISNDISEPRTTVNFYLKRLFHRGWVDKAKSEKSPYPLWRLKNTSNITDNIIDSLASFGIAPRAFTTVTAAEGYEQVKIGYEKILEAGKTERVFIVQGSQAPFAALKNLPIEFIEKVHAFQKRKQIILEGITSDKGLSLFESMSPRELRSHYGRLTVVYLIPDEYLNFDAEIFVFRDSVIIVQPVAARSFLLKDENTARALGSLIKFVEQYARKIDLNSYIKKLIHNAKPDKNPKN